MKTNKSTTYRMTNKGGGHGEIWLYGIIGMDFFGEGVTAKQFGDDLKKLGNVTTIDLRINSDGGVINDARAIYTLLTEHKARVVVHIDGIAASAASFVAMSGDEIHIAESGFFMIHNARGGMFGTAEDFRKSAELLDMFNQTIVDTYIARTGLDEKQVKSWMDAETWFTGREAVEHGFADRIVANMKVAACLTNRDRFRNLPRELRPNRAKAMSLIAR